MAPEAPQPISSLYVHVPFCAQKCHYCAFFSEASSGELVNRYVAALTSELEMVAGDLSPRTVFFGGGTPSILNLRQWEALLKTFARLGLLGAQEWTVECNPATVSLDKAKLWRDHGINRVSMGVQSLDENLLDRLGRVHDRQMVFKSFDIFRQAGFSQINIDLMFAIPGQTMQVWRETLAEALELGSEHLSSYEVIYEEDTTLYDQLKAGQVDVNEELACDMYEVLIDDAGAAGWMQYEIANFARSPGGFINGFPSLACQHNVNYWRGGSFYGLGPSATGYIRGERTKNWANTQLYCEQLEKGRRAIESRETLSSLARAGETAAFGLRTCPGWPFELFHQVTGHDLRLEWKTEMEDLVQRGWATRDDEGFRLTRRGLRFADTAAELFLR
ncbi:MAG: radical SAM family heme chaperone HemW [Verrucomicrobiales bacterium]|nr:radical SAM family heme chaperone HemW [Verrucomicrobiales bacterium]